ncbi:MAG: beta-ketoacyl synthase [Pseudomonadota bacterium]
MTAGTRSTTDPAPGARAQSKPNARGGKTRLPVVVGYGGINPAGRVSFDHAYRRLVIDALPEAKVERTYRSLAQLMGLPASAASDPAQREYMRRHTLVRAIESFDTSRITTHRRATLQSDALTFTLSKRALPQRLPDNWQVRDLDDRNVSVSVTGGLDALLPDLRSSKVTSAGQLPSGFQPDKLYPARSHPRGLQLAIYGASDALRSTGFDLATLKSVVRPDEIAVYSGSAMGQMDDNSYGGLMHAELSGKRVTSKQIALGLPEMPTDFINAYVLGSVGGTAGIIGACASFLYNLKQGVDEIRSGRRRIVMVGNAEAPILPDVIEGYRTMNALADDEAMMALDGLDAPNHRRACRPFAENFGFTLAEAADYFVLMDDELAIELGAVIHAAVPDVFVNADGYKKSIPGPGIGNYLTVAKAMDCVRAILGERSLREHSCIQAHGTGTPQNRVTESHILNELAKTFGIERWLVGAVKSYLGHTIAAASADQLAATIGIWRDGWFPGITTVERIADDVHSSHLDFPLQHREIGADEQHAALLNSKGFGGNNATAAVLSPNVTTRMLTRRYGTSAMNAYFDRAAATQERALDYDETMLQDGVAPIYQFGEGVIEGEDLGLSPDSVTVPGFGQPVMLQAENPYTDMTTEPPDDAR